MLRFFVVTLPAAIVDLTFTVKFAFLAIIAMLFFGSGLVALALLSQPLSF